MRRITLLLVLFSLLLASPARAQTVSQVEVTDLAVSHTFGEAVIFQARLQLSGSVDSVNLLLRAAGEANTRVIPVVIQPDGMILHTYTLSERPLRPFSTVSFSYRVKMSDGQELQTQEFLFRYDDNRFPWQKVEADNLQIYWYVGDLAFGQEALDVARRGLQAAESLLAVSPAAPMAVYVYANAGDLQAALELGGLPWAGGHASPDLRVALVSITPGPEQGLEMDREIPHELAHILIYDKAGEGYPHLPVWLREGLASRAELSANPDYRLAIEQATQTNTLISFTELCGSFPLDSGRAFLAYAQAEAFTGYLFKTYGQSGLLGMLQAYGDGLDCDQGALRATGRSLYQLETGWRSAVSGDGASLGIFFPYLVLLAALLLIPLVNAFLQRKPQNGAE